MISMTFSMFTMRNYHISVLAFDSKAKTHNILSWESYTFCKHLAYNIEKILITKLLINHFKREHGCLEHISWQSIQQLSRFFNQNIYKPRCSTGENGKCQEITKVIKIHRLGTMNVCTQFHGNPSATTEIFQTGPKWWSDTVIPKDVLAAENMMVNTKLVLFMVFPYWNVLQYVGMESNESSVRTHCEFSTNHLLTLDCKSNTIWHPHQKHDISRTQRRS